MKTRKVALTAAAAQLEERRLSSLPTEWWWLKQKNKKLKDDAAEAWETLRRTEVYRRFWREASALLKPSPTFLDSMAVRNEIRSLILKNKTLDTKESAWLPFGNKDPVRSWSALFLAGCDHSLDWIELGRDRRDSVRFHSPILPRQSLVDDHSPMYLAVYHLERDAKGQEVVAECDWGLSISMNKPLPESGLRVLPRNVHDGTFVVIQFELDQPAKGLERTLRDWLETLLGPAGSEIYPPLWNWSLPETVEEKIVAHSKEKVAVIPARQQPFVLCWIPARNNRHLVQIRFNNVVREELRPALFKRCKEYWSKPEIAPGAFGSPSVSRDPWPGYAGISAKLKRKPATIVGFWTALTVYECRRAGIKFDSAPKSRCFLEFFKKHGLPDNPARLRPALAAVRRRLREIDSLYCKIFP